MKHCFVFVISAAVLFLSGCFGEKLSFEQLLDNAMKASVSGDWNGAKNYASRAVKISPKHTGALLLLALSMENTGDSEGALGAASKAVSSNDKSYFAQYTLGRILYEKKRYDACIAPLKAALALRPDSPDPLILLAQASISMNNRKNAKHYYSQLAKMPAYQKNITLVADGEKRIIAVPWSELGVILVTEKPNAAEKYLVYAYKCWPSNPRLVLNLAVYYDVHKKDAARAAQYYRRYLALTKDQPVLEEKRQEVENRLKVLQ